MHIRIHTRVKGNFKEVMQRFDRSLFEALTPPGAQVSIVRFDGSFVGDEVHLQLRFPGGGSQDWISVITEREETSGQIYFVDEGRKLPFFLSSWRHQHIVQNEGENSLIIDSIHFQSHNVIFSLLLYPVLYIQFAWRRPLYRKFFGKPNTRKNRM